MQRLDPMAAQAAATQAAYRRLIDKLDALAAQQRASTAAAPSAWSSGWGWSWACFPASAVLAALWTVGVVDLVQRLG